MATRRWLGNALAIAQRETITIGGTWLANDTLTVTCNGRDLVLTIGTTVTTTQIATELAAALGSTSSTLGTAYSANERGPNIAEFREFVAGDTAPAASGSTVILYGKTKGKPFTVTVSKSSTSGTVSTATTISATGPNHFDNADNWSGATVPVDSDDIVFDSGSIPLLYGLSQGTVTPASITITLGYTGKIGLASINVDDTAYQYTEYRERFLILCASGDSLNTAVTIGGGEGLGASRINLDCNTGQATIAVLGSGQSEVSSVPAVCLKGTNASNVLSVSRGSVGVALLAGESATVATLNVGYRTNQASDAVVTCGSGATLTTINQSGGVLTTASAVTTQNLTGGEWVHLAGAVTTANVDGGACRYRATATLTTAVVGGAGELDFRQDPRSRTVTNCDIFEGSIVRDPAGTVTFTNGIDLNRCDLQTVTLQIPQHKRLTLGTIS
jgi:hypothetical protein